MAFTRMIECCFLTSGHPTSLTNFNSITAEKFESVWSLTHIFVYPVKSCAGIETKSWPLAAGSLMYDRQWMLVSGDGVTMTQKRFPALCSIVPEIDGIRDKLVLKDHFGNSEPLELELNGGEYGDTGSAVVCSDSLNVVDVGGQAFTQWASSFHPSLNVNCRLVGHRPDENAASFSNQADFLLITKDSVKFLAERVNMDWNEVMRRFRPNFVIETGRSSTDEQDFFPFEEDTFHHVWIGDHHFEVTGKCTRCQMICVDQHTGEKDPNVLIALRDLRQWQNVGKNITFGVYMKHVLENGKLVQQAQQKFKLCVGSPVRILRKA